MFNLNEMFSDSTPIIPNEGVLLCQPLNECLICRTVYMDKTLSPEMLTPLVQHNLRHIQVFYNTLRQNLLLKLNPAAAGMFNMFNNVTDLSSTPVGVNPSFLTPQTVNMIHIDNLPGTSAVVPNNVQQPFSHSNITVSDSTLSVLNSVSIANSLNAPIGSINNIVTSASPGLVEISSNAVSSANLLCPSNIFQEHTSSSQLDGMKIKENRESIVTSNIETELCPEVITSIGKLNPNRNNMRIVGINRSDSITGSDSLLVNDVGATKSTQSENLKLDNDLEFDSKQHEFKSANMGTMTSMSTMQSYGVDISSYRAITAGMNNALNDKLVVSSATQISEVPQSVRSEICDMSETLVPISRHNTSISSLHSSIQQKNTVYSQSTNPHTSDRLVKTSNTDICRKCGITSNEYHHHTEEYQQETSTTTNILPQNEGQHKYSDYDEQNVLDSSTKRRMESGQQTDLHTINRSTEVVNTSIWDICEVNASKFPSNIQGHPQETFQNPSLLTLQRKSSVLESSNSSYTSMESLTEQEVISECCADNLNTKTTNSSFIHRIPGYSGSKKLLSNFRRGMPM